MHLLLLCHEYPPEGGGAGRACYNLALEFLKFGHEVTIITSSTGCFISSQTNGKLKIIRVFGSRVSPLKNRIYITFPAFVVLAGIAAANCIWRQREIAILSFFTIPSGFIGILLNLFFGCRVIVSLRGSDVPGYDPNKKLTMSSVYKKFTRLIWKRSTKVVCLSYGLKQMAEETTRDIQFEVIHNGVDPQRFKAAVEREDSEILKMLTVCRLEKIKGLQYLIPALMKLKSSGLEHTIHLTVVGDGGYRKELEDLVTGSGISDWVTFTGYIPQEELGGYYHDSDLFVLPTLSEAFGQVFTEAMACGLPILATRVGGVPEIVGNENGILVEPANIDQLADALRLFIDDKDLRKQMTIANVRDTATRFSWESKAREYIKLFSHDKELENLDKSCC
jgi:glycosyltransferase involved in cell wall biosynthesis